MMKKIFMIAVLVFSAAAFAKAQTISASYKAEMVKMLDALHTKSLLIQTLDQSWSQMGIPNATRLANAVVSDLWPDLLEEYILEYAKHFTLQDLKNVNEFYATPTGKKVCDTINEIAANVNSTMQTKYMTRISNLITKYMQ
ncbi:MAG: DUF2059 domain-containing protein [bacterium]|nr:DUF2059 domain-containing protein [bacterium]